MKFKQCRENEEIRGENLNIYPAFPCHKRSKNLQHHLNSIQHVLYRALPYPLPFGEVGGFEKWIHTALPWISWEDVGTPPDCFSMFFIIKPIASTTQTESFLFKMIQHHLLPDEEMTILSFEHMEVLCELYPNQPLLVAEAKILIKDKKQADSVGRYLLILKEEIFRTLTPCRHTQSFEKEPLSLDHKMCMVRKTLTKLIKRFPDDLDYTLIQECVSMQSLTTPEFCERRPYPHLARLIISTLLTKNHLRHECNLFPKRRHVKILYMPTRISLTFGVKPVLGLCIGLNFFHKYELLDKENILQAAKKYVPNIRIVSASFYHFTLPNSPIHVFYVELERTDGTHLTIDQRKTLKQNMEKEIKKSIEHLVPALFVVRNEEETMHNILRLSKELKSEKDLPHMIITFDQHSQENLIFTVVLLRVKGGGTLPLQELFKNTNTYMRFIPDRVQIVSYLDNRHPIEANVFRMQITKLPAFLRMDLSVNIHLARQEIVSFITTVVGEVRDYNGGMMLKQKELLSQFRHLFKNISSQKQELLEKFFFSLSPIEAQATISLNSIRLFFQTFLKTVECDFYRQNHYVAEFENQQDITIVIIRADDPQYRTLVESALNQIKIHERNLISSSLNYEGDCYLNYLYDQSDLKERKRFREMIMQTLNKWQTDRDRMQTLKLPCFGAISLDPRIGGDQESSLLVKLLFDGLMRIGSNGKPECSLAQSYSISKDKKQYVFTIRESCWSDGSRVVAHDFEYAWKKALSPNFLTPFAYVFYPIKNARMAKAGDVSINKVGIRSLDARTLVVDLEHPAPYFIELTANTLYSPVSHRIDKIDPNWAIQKNEDFVCNGPFRQCGHGSHFAFDFVKNEKYWNSQNIKIDRILFAQVKGKSALKMFQNGQLDCLSLNLLPHEIVRKEISTTKRTDILYYSCSTLWQCFNLNNFPFNNYKIRLAFSMAIDREQIIKKIPSLQNRQPAYTPLPKQLTQHMHSKYLIKENVVLARELFHRGLKELKICADDLPTIHISTIVQRRDVATTLKEQWENILNIKCEVEISSWQEHFKKMTSKTYQIGEIVWTSWIEDPIYTLQSFKYLRENVNFTGWENKKFKRLLNLSDQTIDQKLRRRYLSDAEEMLIRKAAVIPIYYVMKGYLKHQDLILNPHGSNSNIDFSQAYFRHSTPMPHRKRQRKPS